MRQQVPGLSGLLDPLELIKHIPGEPCAASVRRRWVGLEALRYRYQPPNEAFQPPLTHHSLLLFIHTPKEFEARSEGINRGVPPPAGSILVVPAGKPLMVSDRLSCRSWSSTAVKMTSGMGDPALPSAF